MEKTKLFYAMEVLMVVGAIAGSGLLAMHIPISKWGYVLFLISSMAGTYVGMKSKIKSLTLLNGYFTIVNIVGVIRWFF